MQFEDICRKYNIPFSSHTHKSTKGWIQINCPFCGISYENKWHLGFDVSNKRFHCWQCGPKSVYSVFSKLLGPIQASKICKELRTHRKIPKNIEKPTQLFFDKKIGELQLPHKKYLRQRGFGEEIENIWGLKGTGPIAGSWCWRIIIPIFDEQGNMVSYIGRAISEDRKPKYKMLASEKTPVNPRSLVYGAHLTHHKKVLIVEGPTDVWRLGPGAVSLLGIDWTKEQVAFLRNFEEKFILFDNEPQAQKKANSLGSVLSLFPGKVELLQILEKDPAELSRNKARKIMQELGF